MEVLIVGIAMFFNFATIYIKSNNDRGTEAFVDFAAFVAIMYISSMGGQGAMYAGTIASAIFSIFLYFSPPKFLESENTNT